MKLRTSVYTQSKQNKIFEDLLYYTKLTIEVAKWFLAYMMKSTNILHT